MNQASNPTTVAPPLGAYSHTIAVAPDAQWLVISGQVGVNRGGKLANGALKQSEQCYRNILACLKANGMSKHDLVKTTVYLTDSRYIGDFRAARDKILGTDVKPTSTLLVVAGLAAPEMLVEIEAWAAKA